MTNTIFDSDLGVYVVTETPPKVLYGVGATEQEPQNNAEDRLQIAERKSKARSAQIEKNMIEADAKDQLWTIQAALYPGRVFCLVYLGRHDDTEPLESQHRTAPAIFGPLHLIGKTHREVMLQAMNLFVVDEITIKTIR